MLKKILISVGVVLLIAIGFITYRILTTRNLSPAQVATYSSNGLDVTVNYGSPSKRGRLIFGDEKDNALQPYGKYWRLGANAATEITFSKNVTFGTLSINAGTYRMYAVPGPTTFQIALNDELGKWGAFEPDYTRDIGKFDVPVETGPEMESFIILFKQSDAGVNMHMAWDTTIITVPIKLQ